MAAGIEIDGPSPDALSGKRPRGHASVARGASDAGRGRSKRAAMRLPWLLAAGAALGVADDGAPPTPAQGVSRFTKWNAQN